LHDDALDPPKDRPLSDIGLFAAYTMTSVIGLLLLKHSLPQVRMDWQTGLSLNASMLLLAAGACLYISSFAVWLIILARHELSSAYPTAIGLTLVFSSLGAVLLLNESLTPARILGIGLIFLGILLVTRY
jgi:drug/metabolite transporter (DMT)-like permease